MAVTLTNSFESGQSSGTSITAGNSGGGAGNAFDTVTSGTNTVAQYNSTSAYLGTLCGLFSSGAASNASSGNWTTAIGTALPRVYGRTVINGSSFTVVVDFMRCRGTGTQTFRLRINSSGKLELRNTANTVVATSTTTISTGTFYLIRWDVTVGASATGIVYINTNLTTNTPDETMTANSANFGVLNVDEANFGCPVSAISNAAAFRHDMIMITDQGRPGPPTQTATITDTWQTADALTRSLTLPRDLADTWATADVAGRALALPRAVADTWQTADSVDRATADSRPVTDTWATTDTPARSLALPRPVTDTWQTAETPTANTTYPRPVTDTWQTDDALTRAATYARPAADAWTTADSVDRSTAESRTVTDGWQTADDVGRTMALLRQATDAWQTADSPTTQLVLARAVTDGWLTAEDATRIVIFTRPVADTWATTDVATGIAHTPAVLAFYIGEPAPPWFVGDPTNSWTIALPTPAWIVGRPAVPVTSLSALATVYVQIPVTALDSGLPSDPTADSVFLAFMLGRAQPDDADWLTGSWETSSVNGQYFAQALIGPDGQDTLTPGVYTVWVKIVDDPETLIAQSGSVTLY